jgi:hypothetical protein
MRDRLEGFPQLVRGLVVEHDAEASNQQGRVCDFDIPTSPRQHNPTLHVAMVIFELSAEPVYFCQTERLQVELCIALRFPCFVSCDNGCLVLPLFLLVEPGTFLLGAESGEGNPIADMGEAHVTFLFEQPATVRRGVFCFVLGQQTSPHLLISIKNPKSYVIST